MNAGQTRSHMSAGGALRGQLHVLARPCSGAERRGRPILSVRAVLVSEPKSAISKPVYTNANFPVDAEGRTYHLGTKKGEVANRVLSVGTTQRAQALATLLQSPAPGQPLYTHLSSRGFLTITGKYQGVPVSIISTHMGMPNMDFVVRESRAVIDGEMAVIRLGTCGALQRPAKLGDLLVASHGSVAVRRNPDAWDPDAPANTPHYLTSRPVPADLGLAQLLVEEAHAHMGRHKVVEGMNATADSFYSSQGRTGDDFDDCNESLIPQLLAGHPGLISLEMETFHLLDLARCARGRSIRAVGCCIALAERYSNAFLDPTGLQAAELAAGASALSALTRAPLADDISTQPDLGQPGVHYVWS